MEKIIKYLGCLPFTWHTHTYYLLGKLTGKKLGKEVIGVPEFVFESLNLAIQT